MLVIKRMFDSWDRAFGELAAAVTRAGLDGPAVGALTQRICQEA